MIRRPPRSPLFPYPPLFRSRARRRPRKPALGRDAGVQAAGAAAAWPDPGDRAPAGLPRLSALRRAPDRGGIGLAHAGRSEEHTSELQSHLNLVCRLLLEKKK